METTEARFWAKVERGAESECWPWVASVTSTGYGALGSGGRSEPKVYAHRVSYELNVGPIPAGLEIDHLCRNRRCVNPAHLEPVPHRENTLRGESPVAVNAAKTHCVRGHALSGPNVYLRPDAPWRSCRECRRLRDRGLV